MANPKLKTMGEQFGRRSWAEPWKIKMVEPIRMMVAMSGASVWRKRVITPSCYAPRMCILICLPIAVQVP